MSVLLGLPIPIVLFKTPPTWELIAGLMFQAGKGGILLGLLAPHGLLELTAVFLAGATGMRLGWSVISPVTGPVDRCSPSKAVASSSVAVGLVGVLLVSGLIEALVTPSPLPTFVRVGIGIVAEAAFLSYIVYFGRRAAKAGETGDIDDAPDVVPTR